MTRIPAPLTRRVGRSSVLTLLALLGVAVSVGGITGSLAHATMLRQISTAQTEQTFGRATTVSVDSRPRGDVSDLSQLEAVFADLAARPEVAEATRVRSTWPVIELPDGETLVTVHAVDVAYASIHGLEMTAGRWLAAQDLGRSTPALVANESLMERVGPVDVASGPSVLVDDGTPFRATVVGVVPDLWVSAQPEAFVLYDGLPQAGGSLPSGPTLRLHVPRGDADALVAHLEDELGSTAPGWELTVIDTREIAASPIPVRVLVVLGASVLLLVLSTWALMTAPPPVEPHGDEPGAHAQPSRPVGSRTTSRRLRVSVVTTAVAGAVGVGAAVAVTTWAPEGVGLGADGIGMAVLPPFPGWTAVVGATCAILAGVAAGLHGARTGARAAEREAHPS